MSPPDDTTPDDADDDADDTLNVKAKKNVFVRSDEHAWLPARVLEQADREAVVQVFELLAEDKEGAMKINPTSTTVYLRDYPLQSLPLRNVNEYGDMIDLPFLHEPGILYNLRARFFQDQPYTRTGDILIAVNPYQWLGGIYTVEKRKLYLPDNIYDPASNMVKKTVEPHVYEISAMAFRGLSVDKRNQSILVSGESGAGKTETVKICLDQIATIQGGLTRPGALSGDKGEHQVMSSIVQRVVDSNPLLEAFGNAKTKRNDNSSRFGKFVQLQFLENNLVGSHIDVYLLEKSRVVTHTTGERNFHIFYQLLAATDVLKQQVGADVLIGKSTASFPYLGPRDDDHLLHSSGRRLSMSNSSHHKDKENDPIVIDNLSDAQWFEETIAELAIIGIQGESLTMLMRALCVVLQLGTIRFVANDDDKAKVKDSQMQPGGDFAVLAQLMGMDMDVLSQAFLNKTIQVANQEISSPITPQQAHEGCDAYAKDLYSKIFDYLVGTMNAATSASSIHAPKNAASDDAAPQEEGKEHGMIGVLDIFGFEAFEKNQFEQLCINYANERLQYMFASNVFVSLIDEYTREGLVVDFSYETNSDVINLISGKVGILAILNEECIRPGGNEMDFVKKTVMQNKNSSRMFKTKGLAAEQFGVKHYAGPVIYTATEFLRTNKDLMPMDLQKVSCLSTNTVIAQGYAEPKSSHSSQGRKLLRTKTNIAKNTVSTKFRTQLNSLLNTLQTTQTRYIRCIKPNRLKQPRIFENTEILRQLQSGGVIAAIKIASASYPNKMEHHAVVKRFRNLAAKPNPAEDIKTQVQKLLTTALKNFVSPIKGGTNRLPFTLGKTRTYFRTGALEYLENGRNDNIGFFAIIIQRNHRMAPIRKSFLRNRKAAVVIQAIMRGFIWKRRVERMPQCAVVIQCWCRCVLAKLAAKRIRSAVRIQRCWCAARTAIRGRRRNKAAISIQRITRGAMQRHKFRNEIAKRNRAVLVVQKTVRGFVQLVKFRVVLAKKCLEEKNAATQIQKVVRGYQQRARFEVMLANEKVRKNKAAVIIQSTGRGYIQIVKYQAMKKAEQERIAAEIAAEEARLKAEQLAAEKAAEAEQIAAEKAAAEARQKAEQLAEEKRIAAEKRAEETRLAAERQAEEVRLAAERDAEKARLEAEKEAEKERLAAERRAEKERLAAEKQAEKERLAAERQAEKERLEAEKLAADRARIALEERLAAAEKRAEEERLKAERLAAENAALTNRMQSSGGYTVDEEETFERAIRAAQEKAAADSEVKEGPDDDEELELAMEMALLAMQNPELKPTELNKLLGKPAAAPQPSGGGVFGRMFQGFGRLAKAATAPAPVVEGAPWASSGVPSFGLFRSNAGGRSVADSFGRSRGGNTFDDETIAETVATMMLPDSLTANELRERRVVNNLQKDIRKVRKQVSDKTKELRNLKSRGDKERTEYMKKKNLLESRYHSSTTKLEAMLQSLQRDDLDPQSFLNAIESASISLGHGSLAQQKESLNEEEKMQFDVQTLQEVQLVRQMRQMYATGVQLSLQKKHTKRDISYLENCKTWLSDSAKMKAKMEKLESSLDEMRELYEETIWSQEAAFARHDPNMTIRETLDDLF